ncbi:MAG: hypothetical protein KC493_11930, partial [Bacteriovoracaceae bacterium]|nr:hypothetical protein [Bacteriovoracaceae bacterium]
MSMELDKRLRDLRLFFKGEKILETPMEVKKHAGKRIEESFKVKKYNLKKLVSSNSGLDRAYELLSKSEREQFLMSPVVACNLMYQWTRKDTFELNSWLHLFLTWKGKTKNTVHFTGADFIGENFYKNGTLFYTSPKVHGIVVDLKSGSPDYKTEEEKIIVNKIEESLGFLKEHFPSYFELVTGM